MKKEIGKRIEFWQSQSPTMRFRATWNMVVDYYKVKGLDINKLRLDKSKEMLLRRRR